MFARCQRLTFERVGTAHAAPACAAGDDEDAGHAYVEILDAVPLYACAGLDHNTTVCVVMSEIVYSDAALVDAVKRNDVLECTALLAAHPTGNLAQRSSVQHSAFAFGPSGGPLANCSLSAEHVATLCDALNACNNISAVDVSCNDALGDAGVAALCDRLAHNAALTHVNLSRTGCNDAGAASAASWLQVNSTLCSVNLSGNSIADQGAVSLAEVLRYNIALQNFNLASNRIGSVGMLAMADMLSHNCSISEMQLSGNTLAEAELAVLVAAVEHNHTVTSLSLNTFGGDDSVMRAHSNLISFVCTVRRFNEF